MKPIAGVLAFVATLAWAAVAANEPDLAQAARAIVIATNDLRRAEGLAHVAESPRLTQTARDFAAFLARSDVFEHTADGRRPWERAQSHGYDYCFVAENIAYEFRSRGFATAELARAFVEGWRSSRGHRRNMLERDVTETGVALARSARTGRYYGVQMFGRPRAAARGCG